jgi:hypothetical protein
MQGSEGGASWGGESVQAGSSGERGGSGDSRVAAAKRLLGQQRHLDRRQPPESLRKFFGTR